MAVCHTSFNDKLQRHIREKRCLYIRPSLVCRDIMDKTGLVIQDNVFQGAMNNIEMGCTDNTSTVDGIIIRENSFSNYSQLSKGKVCIIYKSSFL